MNSVLLRKQWSKFVLVCHLDSDLGTFGCMVSSHTLLHRHCFPFLPHPCHFLTSIIVASLPCTIISFHRRCNMHSPPLPDRVAPIPPQVPPDSVYTRCYCEENIYLLATEFEARRDIKDRWEVCVAFISNAGKTVALWNQTARPGLVVWDYHVILLLRPWQAKNETADRKGAASWVYDFDTQLPTPCTAQEYIAWTFPIHGQLPEEYQSFFRVIPAPTYLSNFASDRSHMLGDDHDDVSIYNPEGRDHGNPNTDMPSLVKEREDARYISPPPGYPAICGPRAKEKGVKTNLMEAFVRMNNTGCRTECKIEEVETYGQVLDLEGFRAWCHA
ncbi:hypothetical protein OE88DRAFT_1015972 [Heliocybe sulcata]|uniref:Protein N-terminal glutamine amidohydrolase n=1 Tax=Heliocybe sulcata TaxID=5364 RepID=A0A5C3ND15_9AGAM|nr:hypothetical protein OE88DRAFT_1015972 [Heliocybe sulcata]